MNERSPKLRYWITFLLKDVAVGETFTPGLLHMTVIPWFVTNLEDEEVINAFRQKFSGQTAFKISVGELTDFKHKRKISVNLVVKTSEILKLHQKSLELFEKIEGRWAVRTPHVGKDYVPHIRRRPGKGYKEGDELKINSVYLISADRHEDGVRTVAAKVNLNE